jgi:hypothetical protein
MALVDFHWVAGEDCGVWADGALRNPRDRVQSLGRKIAALLIVGVLRLLRRSLRERLLRSG